MRGKQGCRLGVPALDRVPGLMVRGTRAARSCGSGLPLCPASYAALPVRTSSINELMRSLLCFSTVE